MYFFSPKNCRTGSRKTFKTLEWLFKETYPTFQKEK